MNIKALNVSLLSFSIITALFPLNAMATKLTIEQRLELLENELSQNKQELKATQNELGVYKSRLSTLQKSITENKYKSASLAEISATSPVADNIKNENGEQISDVTAYFYLDEAWHSFRVAMTYGSTLNFSDIETPTDQFISDFSMKNTTLTLSNLKPAEDGNTMPTEKNYVFSKAENYGEAILQLPFTMP